MSENMTCAHRPPTERACMEPARWYGSFLVGAWLSIVPLCDEHARVFQLLVESGKAAIRAGGTGFHVQMQIGVVNEIMSLADNRTQYGQRQLWTCSECGLPIVRSLEGGKWIIVGEDGSERPLVNAIYQTHEHRPG